MTDYHAVLTANALRSLRSVPPRVAEPLVAFIFGSLATDPRRRGEPLQRELACFWAARRGDSRIAYRLDDDTRTMNVLKIGHRAQATARSDSADGCCRRCQRGRTSGGDDVEVGVELVDQPRELGQRRLIAGELNLVGRGQLSCDGQVAGQRRPKRPSGR